jgi:hypothetical protein
MKDRKARKIMNRLEDPRCDPLPEAARTGPWFQFGHDDNKLLSVIDPANVPGPCDKVSSLMLAWQNYRDTDDAINEERKKFRFSPEQEFEELPPAEGDPV